MLLWQLLLELTFRFSVCSTILGCGGVLVCGGVLLRGSSGLTRFGRCGLGGFRIWVTRFRFVRRSNAKKIRDGELLASNLVSVKFIIIGLSEVCSTCKFESFRLCTTVRNGKTSVLFRVGLGEREIEVITGDEEVVVKGGFGCETGASTRSGWVQTWF